MLKAVFFDWGDTFTESGFIDLGKEINNLLTPYDLNWDNFFPHWRNFYILRSQGKIESDEEMDRQLKRVLGKDIPLEKARDLIVNSHIIPQENIEIVKELKRDYKVGLLTNNVKNWIEKVLKNYSIEDLFDALIVSSEVGARKPDAQIYYVALKTLSSRPEEAVFVSDELAEDLIGAKGCGMKTIWLDTGVENEWKKREREIAEFFQPDAIIKNLREVIPIIKTM